MDRRRSPRVEAVFPVRVWGMDANTMPFMETVRATNISKDGMLLQGVRRQILLDEQLEVQLGEKKCRFRVVWVGKIGTRRSGELGLETMESETPLWNINLRRCSQFAAHV